MQPTVYLIKCYDHKFLDFSEMNSTTCMLPWVCFKRELVCPSYHCFQKLPGTDNTTPF